MEMGAIRPLDGATLLQTRSQISSARNMLQSRFGVRTNMMKQPGGPITDTTLQAMLAEGCVMISKSVNVVQSKHKDYQTAEQIVSEIFPRPFAHMAGARSCIFGWTSIPTIAWWVN